MEEPNIKLPRISNSSVLRLATHTLVKTNYFKIKTKNLILNFDFK